MAAPPPTKLWCAWFRAKSRWFDYVIYSHQHNYNLQVPHYRVEKKIAALGLAQDSYSQYEDPAINTRLCASTQNTPHPKTSLPSTLGDHPRVPHFRASLISASLSNSLQSSALSPSRLRTQVLYLSLPCCIVLFCDSLAIT